MTTICVKLSRTLLVFALLISSIFNLKAQELKTAAVFGFHVHEIAISQEMAVNILGIELSKIQQYQVLDKLDLMEVESKSEIKFIDCYGRECLKKAGKNANVDYAVSGSIESLGNKMVVSIKVLNVEKSTYEKTYSMEFVKNVNEVQRMVRIVIRSAYGLENRTEEVDMLAYYEEPPQTTRSQLKNSGPRMGLAYISGQTGDVIQMSEKDGGYDAFPIMSQFGYQFEKVYISAGNFQALAEGLFLVTGIEQSLFIPSMTFLNGFRSSSNGWEVGFGPSINVKKFSTGFYDANGDYVVTEDRYPELDIVKRLDSRGTPEISASWVWALGKTFRSGYLNIPVNAYFSHGKYGWYTGMSMGFNIAK